MSWKSMGRGYRPGNTAQEKSVSGKMIMQAFPRNARFLGKYMENSPKMIPRSPSTRKSSGSSLPQVSTDERHLELVSDTEQRLSPHENCMGVKNFTPTSEKKSEKPQANVPTYRRLTPEESLEKIKAASRLKSMRLRFKFARRPVDQQENTQKVGTKNLMRSQNLDRK